MARIIRRRTPAPAAPASTPVSLIAATQPVSMGKSQAGSSSRDATAWKADAWDYYDMVGELRFVCQWLENSLSRCALIASTIDPKTGQPTGQCDDQLAVETVADIAGGPAGQAALLGHLATFLTVPGEGFVAIIHPTDAEGRTCEEWHVLSESEVKKKSSGGIELTLPTGEKYEFNSDTDTIERVYRPHPRRAIDSDSPVRACLPILREIVRMGQNIEAAGKSRNAGNGLLVLPKELSMPAAAMAPTAELPPPADPDAPGLPLPPIPQTEVPVTATDVMVNLKTTMETAISDPSAAAALVPIVLQGPGEFLDKIRHITFASDITETSLKTREAATRRLAMSLDVPAEVLLGLSQGNHWSSWMVDESAIKTHIIPLMTLICDSLTAAILRPMLAMQQHPDPESITLWFDPSGLTLRPNRAEDAKQAFDRGAISSDALRRELGFADTDAPKAPVDSEQQKAMALELVKAAPALLPVLAPLLGLPIDAAGLAPAPVAGPVPAGESAPIPIRSAAAVRVAATMAARRLMEVTGKRQMTREVRGKLRDVAPGDIHHELNELLGPTKEFASRMIQEPDRRELEVAAWEAGAHPVRFTGLVTRKVVSAIDFGSRASDIEFTDEELLRCLP